MAKIIAQNQSEKEEKDSQRSLLGANSVSHSYNSFTDYKITNGLNFQEPLQQKLKFITSLILFKMVKSFYINGFPIT